MSSRDAILTAIRKSLGDRPDGGPQASAERITSHPKGVTPSIVSEAVLDRFTAQAKAAAATIQRVRKVEAPAALAEWLRERNLPKVIRMGADARLMAIDWASAGLETASGPTGGDDLNGVSHAFGAVAETGTLVLASGQDNPTTLNFLPENHIVLVSAADIAATYEEIWPRLRSAYGERAMPRTVNMITGPSRSADIEQTLILGAHGPVRLHIMVVDD